MFSERINAALDKRRAAQLTRKIVPLVGANQASFIFQDRAYDNFSSNDYLGLASSDELKGAWQAGLDRYGSGSGASPLVTGFSLAHQALEQELCDWLGYDRAVLFSSGFSANQALLFTLLDKRDLLLQDRRNHASLMEAGMHCHARMKRFKHNDCAHLSRLLNPEKPQTAIGLPTTAVGLPITEKADNSGTLVVTEGVFSMDGDSAPLTDIAALCHSSGSWLAVDDAHGVGVLGEMGKGSCAAVGVKPQILVVTFGKAFGLSGAAILCQKNVGDYLSQFARHHVYSTAIPPAQAHAIQHAAHMLQKQDWRREKLQQLQSCFDQALADQVGFVQTNTPIKPMICGSAQRALWMAECLKNKGFWVTAIRPPTVEADASRIRITLTANHSIEQVQALAAAIIQINRK